jgi:hypothetical protein
MPFMALRAPQDAMPPPSPAAVDVRLLYARHATIFATLRH